MIPKLQTTINWNVWNDDNLPEENSDILLYCLDKNDGKKTVFSLVHTSKSIELLQDELHLLFWVYESEIIKELEHGRKWIKTMPE